MFYKGETSGGGGGEGINWGLKRMKTRKKSIYKWPELGEKWGKYGEKGEKGGVVKKNEGKSKVLKAGS